MAALAGLVLLSGCADDAGPSSEAAEPTALKVAWVNQGAVDEDPWTRAHGAARDQVDAALGDRVETTFVENVDLETEAEDTIEELIADGNELIISTSFGFSEYMAAAAERHPDVAFEQARGVEVTDNLSTFSGAHEEPIYLVGMAGAAASSTHAIGFVATVPEPETIRHIDAYTLGARLVDPEVQVRVAWVGSWYDPERERRLAEDLIAGGADVIATGATSYATAEAAQAAGVAWSGHDSDAGSLFPDVWLTASQPDWGPYYVRRVRDVLDGRWTGTAYYGDMADGFTGLASFGQRVDGPTRERIAATRDAIVDGRAEVFTGPLRDDAGRQRVPAGTTMSLEQLLAIDWFVDGATEVVPPP